ncbi:MAG: hypothetical protein NVSMB47_19490 [Polyangiales bacterium]
MTRTALLLSTFLALGCGSSDAADAADTGSDDAADAAFDGDGSAADVRLDAPIDGSTDVSRDATPDAPLDAPLDAPVDAAPSAKWLIKHGQDIPTPTFVHDHIKEMEAMPFDGVVVTIGASSTVQLPTPVDLSTIVAELAPLRSTTFTTLTHDFVIASARAPTTSWFDDDAVAARNFANLAQAARDAGLVGIVFDEESYFGTPAAPLWDGSLCAGRPLAECQQRVRTVGADTMAAIVAAWPTAIVLCTYGPWVSEAKTATYFAGVFPYNDVSAANPLMGPFFLGMAEATVGTAATLIDGGEMYTLRDPAHFARAYAWQKTELAKTSALFTPSLADAYPGAVSVSWGVYDRPWEGAAMDAPTFGTTIERSMKAADQWVWVYTEAYDWWGTHNTSAPAVPAAWVAAAKAGRSAGAK